jgi:2-keto-4-pentenoate hydratase/2-oxohepta-3-ene-1,7-dioic acid hydratase in catechol pathway
MVRGSNAFFKARGSSNPEPWRQIVRLANCSVHSGHFLGEVVADGVYALVSRGVGGPRTLRSIMELAESREEDMASLITALFARGDHYSLDAVKLGAPIPNPRKFLAIGMNYKAHAEEAERAGIVIPQTQLWFNKQVSCISGPTDDVLMPPGSTTLDYEGELAVVIGRTCRNATRESAMSYVAGFMVCNDISEREWQFKSPTITLGKSFDTHGPTGPWLTLSDEVENVSALVLRTFVNGELRQETAIGDMIYPIADQISYLSAHMTLEPGDILSTGTPSGIGFSRDPKAFLAIGDHVRVEIDGLGAIENRVALSHGLVAS